MDTPETLAADLLKAGAEAIVATRAVVQKGALNIKNDAKRNVQQSAPVHNAYAHNAITYDTTIRPLTVEAEIGYDKDKRGGSLGNILEYGTRKNPPHRDLGRALDREAEHFDGYLAAAIAKLL